MIVDAAETDWPLVESIALEGAVFSDSEMDALAAVWEEYVLLGPEDSGYQFLVERADGGAVRGFVAYGPRDLTDGVFDLYHLVVDRASRLQSTGGRLLRAAEAEAREAGARMMVAEVSSASRYEHVDEFCLKMGYTIEAGIKDFYALGEDLAIFVKRF